MRHAAGIALPAVLWIMALLGVLATGYAFAVRTETALTHNWLDSARARAAAEAGLQLAILDRLDLQEARWPVDGSVQELEFEEVGLRIAVLDESGRIDLNHAPEELLDGLLMTQGLEGDRRAALVDAILDWRDPDDLRRLNGAEDADYAGAGFEYGAGDAPFDSVEDLSRVMGMTPELYWAIEGALTVHSGAPTVNPAVAPREVLLALPGASEETVDAYLEQHQDAMIAAASPFPGVSTRHVASRAGKTFTVEVEARLPNGALGRLSAVIRMGGAGGRPFRVLAWREAAGLQLIPSEDRPPEVEDS